MHVLWQSPKSLKNLKRNLFSQQKSPKTKFLKPGNLFRKCLLRWQDISLCLLHIILSLCISFQIIAYTIVLVCISSSTHFFKGQRNYSFIAFLPLLLLCIEDPKIIKISFKELPFCEELIFFSFLKIIFLRNFQRILLLVIFHICCAMWVFVDFSLLLFIIGLYMFLMCDGKRAEILRFLCEQWAAGSKVLWVRTISRNSFHIVP